MRSKLTKNYKRDYMMKIDTLNPVCSNVRKTILTLNKDTFQCKYPIEIKQEHILIISKSKKTILAPDPKLNRYLRRR